MRMARLRNSLAERKLDGILISNFYNILYLTGFKTLVDNEREAWLLVTQKNHYLFTDMRYSSDSHDIRYLTTENRLVKHLSDIMKEENIKTLGFEGEDLKYHEFDNLKKNLTKSNFVQTLGVVVKQREIKEDSETAKIKKACEIADGCLTEIVKNMRVGQTEKEIAFKIEFLLKEKGYDLSFYPIVAVDANSAAPHYDTRAGNDKKIYKNSVVLIDFGAKYQNYLSDMTRMVFVGTPDDEKINTYNSLLTAQSKTTNRLKSGVSLKDVDDFCRNNLKSAGLPDYSHSTGHGVGLEIHEHPKVSFMSEDMAIPGQIITVEPGVYIRGKWGMRIEDTVSVKKDGVDVLTQFKKDLLII